MLLVEFASTRSAVDGIEAVVRVGEGDRRDRPAAGRASHLNRVRVVLQRRISPPRPGLRNQRCRSIVRFERQQVAPIAPNGERRQDCDDDENRQQLDQRHGPACDWESPSAPFCGPARCGRRRGATSALVGILFAPYSLEAAVEIVADA